jgi:hypothetical protein
MDVNTALINILFFHGKRFGVPERKKRRRTGEKKKVLFGGGQRVLLVTEWPYWGSGNSTSKS